MIKSHNFTSKMRTKMVAKQIVDLKLECFDNMVTSDSHSFHKLIWKLPLIIYFESGLAQLKCMSTFIMVVSRLV